MTEYVAKQIRRVRFDEKLEHLVDEQGIQYEGRRYHTIVAESAGGWPTSQSAEDEALHNLESLAIKNSAEAYELIGCALQDSKQEYDPRPWTATAKAILYKK